jgi:hypothetical protein
MQAALVSGLQELGVTRQFGAEKLPIREDADTAKIQTIRIPASCHCDVPVVPPLAVPTAGFDQAIQLGGIQPEEGSAEIAGEVSRTLSVPGVKAVILTLRIMQEGEQLDDSRIGSTRPSQSQAIGSDPRPMRQAVDAEPIEPELSLKQAEE